MKKGLSILINILLFAVIVFLAWQVVKSIQAPIKFNHEQKARETKVVERLIDIRNAEVSVGGAYSVRYNFNDIVNNGPTSVISYTRGKSIDLLASIGVNFDFFRFSADIRAPFALKGNSRLVYNTVKTKYGNTATISADTMNLKAEVFFGKFTFTAGAVFNGFAGRVADLLKAFKDADGRRAALAGIVDPEISTIFAKAEFAPTIGALDFSVYGRADLAAVNSKIAIVLSAGAKVSF